MEHKDIVILGIIVGISFFFIGAIISNVFPGSETDLLPYKVSAVIKLIGLGVLTTAMVIGGIIIEDIEKNLKLLLLLIGLILLIIYSIASPAIQWEIPSYSNGPSSYDTRPTGYGLPGFEPIIAVCALVLTLLWMRKRKLT